MVFTLPDALFFCYSSLFGKDVFLLRYRNDNLQPVRWIEKRFVSRKRLFILAEALKAINFIVYLTEIRNFEKMIESL